MIRREISLSEQIQITVIIEKKEAGGKEARTIDVTHEIGATLMSTLLHNKLISGNFCGGRGTCGRCRVQFLQSAPMPSSMERRAFTADELRDGYRLACMVRPKSSCVIRLDVIETRPIEILTGTTDDMIGMSPAFDQTGQGDSYIIAVDLGTTTIAMQLTDIKTGQAADTYCAMNPQRSYGADVLSRVQAANEGNADALRNCVWEVLRAGVQKFYDTLARKTKPGRSGEADGFGIACMCIAGNTVMEHLLMGLSTENLGKSPFMPVTLALQEYDFPIIKGNGKKEACHLPGQNCIVENLRVYITPGISAFVGGDIAAGLYGCQMLPEEQTKAGQDKEAALFIDLGTNGEMAITDGRRMIVTAAAAGPAFEGGAGAAVPGSDMIALTAELLRKGILDETGLLAEPYFEGGISVSPPGKAGVIHLTQKDIRDLQMAKAAVRAGVEILQEKMGYPTVTRVCLAGGFGYYLNVDAAVAVGLLPAHLRDCTKAVGNTSLAGAFRIGRDLCMGRTNGEALMQKIRLAESVNLAETEGFEKRYVEYLNFPGG